MGIPENEAEEAQHARDVDLPPAAEADQRAATKRAQERTEAEQPIRTPGVELEAALQAIAALESEDDSGTSARAISRALVYVGAEIGALAESLSADALPACTSGGHEWDDPSPSGMQVCEKCNLWRLVTVPLANHMPDELVDFSSEVGARVAARTTLVVEDRHAHD